MGLTHCNPQRLRALLFPIRTSLSHPLHVSAAAVSLPLSSHPSLHPAILVNIDSVKHGASKLISVSVWISPSLSEDDY